MPTHINLIIPLDEFLISLEDIAKKYDIKCYIEKRDINKKAYYEKVLFGEIQKNKILDSQYNGFFFCSKEIDKETEISFYNRYASFSIEGTGGRETLEEIEVINLRIISKTPDNNIRLFFNAIFTKMKKDDNIAKGVVCGFDNINKNYFYHFKIKHKRIWIDLDKRTVECKIPSLI